MDREPERKREHASHRRDLYRRRKRVRRRRILLLCTVVVVCCAALYGGIRIARGVQKTQPVSTEEAAPISLTDQDAEESGQSVTEKKEQDQVPDRSSFAVNPSVPCGAPEESTDKVVYLTFDDGPSSNTQAILDILDQYGAKATFFVTNINPEYTDMIKTEYEKGHTIGLHTYSHEYNALYASEEAYFADLDQIGQVVQKQIGYVPCFIRFPGGSSNTVSAETCGGIMTALATDVQTKGYQYYDWNCSFGDGAVRPTNEVIECAEAGTEHNNIIMLAHDANGKESSVEALPTIIEYYQSLGYTFQALDRNTYAAHHGINN